jgi:hypothetical protein
MPETSNTQGESSPRKNFNRIYLIGMIAALFIILAIFYVFAFSRQAPSPGGHATPTASLTIAPNAA